MYIFFYLKPKKRFGLIAFATGSYQNTLLVRLGNNCYDKEVLTTSCVIVMILHYKK